MQKLTVNNLKESPPGNWQYTQPESGMKFTEVNFNDLLGRVIAHRRANNYPIGGLIRQEILQQNAERLLDIVPDRVESYEPEGPLLRAKRFAASMAKWAAGGFAVVTEEQYQVRLKTCESCGFFRGLNETWSIGCDKCGCSKLKLYVATESCPDNPPRWKAL